MSGHTATPGEPIGWIVRINDVKCFYWERGVAEWKAGEFEDQHGATATIDPVFLANSHADLVRVLEGAIVVIESTPRANELISNKLQAEYDKRIAAIHAALATLTARKVG